MEWKRRVLVVEDEPLIASLLCESLGHEGFDAVASHTAIEAKESLFVHDPDAVLIDINLGSGPSGIQFGQFVHKTHPHVAQVFLTKFADPKTAGIDHWELPPGSSLLAKDQISDAKALVDALELALQESPAPIRHDQFASGLLSGLTKTQFTILQMAADGFTNSAIATHRNTTERNVEQRLQSVYQHFGIEITDEVNPRARAIRIFLEAGGMPGGHLIS